MQVMPPSYRTAAIRPFDQNAAFIRRKRAYVRNNAGSDRRNPVIIRQKHQEFARKLLISHDLSRKNVGNMVVFNTPAGLPERDSG
jgi:hypothetical protein